MQNPQRQICLRARRRDEGVSFVFDSEHTKNIFQVTHQTTVVGKYVNRYDVTILVNGLPLIQVELKRRGIDIREAVNQVMRYKSILTTGCIISSKSSLFPTV